MVRRQSSRPVGARRRKVARYRIALGAERTNFARSVSTIGAQGGTVTWVRSYQQTQSASAIETYIRTHSDQGYKVYISFKSSFTWSQIASGSDDTRWTAIGNSLATITPAGAWCFNHEPDNDVLSYGSNANGDAFCAAFDHIANIIKPLAPDWYASACLTEIVFPSYPFSRGANWVSSPDPNHWIPTTATLLGVDYYWWRGVADGAGAQHWAVNESASDSNTPITTFLSYAGNFGIPLCFPEFNSAVRDPSLSPNDEVNQRAPWFQTVANDWRGDSRIVAFFVYDVNDQDISTLPNWAITDDDQPPTNATTVAAFKSIGD